LRLEGKPDSSLGVLTELLQAKAPELRRRAARELELLGSAARPAIPALVAALKDPDLNEEGRRSFSPFKLVRGPGSPAAAALVTVGPEAAPALRKALNDREDHVRAHALLALASLPLQDDEVVPALRRCLKDREPEVKLIAAIHLWRRTGDPEPVVPVLLDI